MSIELLLQILQTIVNIIGLPLLIWSVLTVVKQAREMASQNELIARATRSSVYQSVIETTMGINRLWLEYPNLKPYFFENKEITAEHAEYARVTTIADMMIDLIDDVYVQSSNMPEYDWDSWKKAFQGIFATSPILRQYYVERRRSIPKPLREFLERK